MGSYSDSIQPTKHKTKRTSIFTLGAVIVGLLVAIAIGTGVVINSTLYAPLPTQAVLVLATEPIKNTATHSASATPTVLILPRSLTQTNKLVSNPPTETPTLTATAIRTPDDTAYFRLIPAAKSIRVANVEGILIQIEVVDPSMIGKVIEFTVDGSGRVEPSTGRLGTLKQVKYIPRNSPGTVRVKAQSELQTRRATVYLPLIVEVSDIYMQVGQDILIQSLGQPILIPLQVIDRKTGTVLKERYEVDVRVDSDATIRWIEGTLKSNILELRNGIATIEISPKRGSTRTQLRVSMVTRRDVADTIKVISWGSKADQLTFITNGIYYLPDLDVFVTSTPHLGNPMLTVNTTQRGVPLVNPFQLLVTQRVSVKRTSALSGFGEDSTEYFSPKEFELHTTSPDGWGLYDLQANFVGKQIRQQFVVVASEYFDPKISKWQVGSGTFEVTNLLPTWRVFGMTPYQRAKPVTVLVEGWLPITAFQGSALKTGSYSVVTQGSRVGTLTLKEPLTQGIWFPLNNGVPVSKSFTVQGDRTSSWVRTFWLATAPANGVAVYTPPPPTLTPLPVEPVILPTAIPVLINTSTAVIVIPPTIPPPPPPVATSNAVVATSGQGITPQAEGG
jgi:hypothetical protein